MAEAEISLFHGLSTGKIWIFSAAAFVAVHVVPPSGGVIIFYSILFLLHDANNKIPINKGEKKTAERSIFFMRMEFKHLHSHKNYANEEDLNDNYCKKYFY